MTRGRRKKRSSLSKRRKGQKEESVERRVPQEERGTPEGEDRQHRNTSVRSAVPPYNPQQEATPGREPKTNGAQRSKKKKREERKRASGSSDSNRYHLLPKQTLCHLSYILIK